MKRIPRTIVMFGISLVLMGAVIALRFNTLPPQIPLLYSLPDTDSRQVVDIWFLALIPIASFIFINVNNVLAKRVFKGDAFIRNLVFYADLIIIAMFAYIFVKIVFLIS